MIRGGHTGDGIDDRIAELAIIREGKRNAVSDGPLAEIEAFRAGLPREVRAVILYGRGEHVWHVVRPAEEHAPSLKEGATRLLGVAA